jgi:hypothetical protein
VPGFLLLLYIKSRPQAPACAWGLLVPQQSQCKLQHMHLTSMLLHVHGKLWPMHSQHKCRCWSLCVVRFFTPAARHRHQHVHWVQQFDDQRRNRAHIWFGLLANLRLCTRSVHFDLSAQMVEPVVEGEGFSPAAHHRHKHLHWVQECDDQGHTFDLGCSQASAHGVASWQAFARAHGKLQPMHSNPKCRCWGLCGSQGLCSVAPHRH